ncbi:hypothetical protein PVK06_040227 [Gossypium arboreum]|uniref:Secreted protein n=1 Tax=Gossypium arboreum TaxID=29729 RepID=A0ABR0N712_GOSAR|nr:hypothetical protein PVK06_040227 [Gossypium arboreum]
MAILMQMLMQQSMPMSMFGTFLTHLRFSVPYGYTPILTQTPRASLLFRGVSLSQPPNTRVADTLWQVRTTQQSTTEEDDDSIEP